MLHRILFIYSVLTCTSTSATSASRASQSTSASSTTSSICAATCTFAWTTTYRWQVFTDCRDICDAEGNPYATHALRRPDPRHGHPRPGDHRHGDHRRGGLCAGAICGGQIRSRCRDAAQGRDLSHELTPLLPNWAGSTRRAQRSNCSSSATRISRPGTGPRRSHSATLRRLSISWMATARPVFPSDARGTTSEGPSACPSNRSESFSTIMMLGALMFELTKRSVPPKAPPSMERGQYHCHRSLTTAGHDIDLQRTCARVVYVHSISNAPS
ncbi:hypothetical protein D3C76_239770 [compost metagenome]